MKSRIKPGWSLLLFGLFFLFACSGPVLCQEPPTIIDLPDRLPSLKIRDLRPIDSTRGVLRLDYTGSGPVTVRCPPGILFVPDGGEGGSHVVMSLDSGSSVVSGSLGGGQGSGGTQVVMSLGSGTAVISGRLGGSQGRNGNRMVKINGPTPIFRPASFHPSPARWNSSMQLYAQASNNSPARSVEVVIEYLCVEPERPDPNSTTVWRMSDQTRLGRMDVARLRAAVLEISRALAKVDAEAAELARHVALIEKDGEWDIEYSGPPLTEAQANFFRTVDWSRSGIGETVGKLNRPMVVQFALWALTHNYRQEDLSRRLAEERFAHMQPKEASLRWSICHLLAQAGYSRDLFLTAADSKAKHPD